MEPAQEIPKLVVVGSSAGGIEALSALVGSLKRDFPAPIVIAQHLDPHRQSHLADVLARRTELPIRTVEKDEPLEAGVVFVVPANHHVEITDSHVQVKTDVDGGSKPSVDLLLSTAADSYGEGLIAVILTGTGSDGASGARHVKETGGTVIIENPQTARYPGMPLAVPPTTVDVIADIANMGSVLYDLLSEASAPARLDDD